LTLYRKYELVPEKYIRNYAELLQNLSKIYRDLNNLKEAKLFLEESLKIYIDLYGMNHKLVGFGFDVLATIYKKIGDLPQALQHQLKAVDILDNLNTKLKDKSSKSFHGNQNKHNLLLLEIPVVKAISTNSSPTNSPSKKPLCKKKWSFFETAQDFLYNNNNEKPLVEENKITNINVVGVLNNLGIIYRELKELEKARDTFQKALFVLRNNKGEDDFKLLEVLNNLASCWLEIGNDIEKCNRAKNLLEEGVAIATKKSERGVKEIREVLELNLALANRKIKLFTKK